MGRGLPKSYIKKYGISKKAWREYRKDQTEKGRRSKPRKGGSKTTKKKKGGRRGYRIVGNIGPKGLIVSAGLLALAKYLTRRFAPQVGAYTTAVSAIGAGAAGKVMGTGSSLLQFGAVDGVSELLTDLALPGGMVTIPGMGPRANGVRYDV